MFPAALVGHACMQAMAKACATGCWCCAVRFEFDAIHQPHVTQEEVFAAVKPLCESVLDGYNITVLAYGQVRACPFVTPPPLIVFTCAPLVGWRSVT